MEHTKGPWKYDQMNAKVIATAGIICRLTDLSGETYAKPLTAKKDGQLLAAAPDLLTACEVALVDLEDHGLAECECVDGCTCPPCQLHAAIAAARGTR